MRNVIGQLDLDLRALGHRPGRRALEVLAEVLWRKMRERSAPDPQASDLGCSLGFCEAFDLAQQRVDQRLLVHSVSTRSTTSSTARATAGVSPSPAARLSASMP